MEKVAARNFRLRVTQPEDFVEAIRGSRIDARVLARSEGFSQLDRVQLTRTCFDTVEISSTLLVSGEMAADCYTLVYVSKCPRHGHLFTHSQQHGPGYLGFFPPGGSLDALLPAGYANATLTVPEDLFLREISHRFPEIPDAWLERGAALRLPEQASRQLACLLAARREMDRSSANWLADGMACVHFENDLLEAFLDALRAAHHVGPQPATANRLRRYAAIRRVRDHLAGHAGLPLRLNDLCEIGGVSRRGLEYVFKDLLGIGANAFVRCHRLHGTRRAILAANSKPGIIKQVALDWGFWHLGRFAADYRKLFGESPSATLARRA
jgi:AraC-like DNA-binding protein